MWINIFSFLPFSLSSSLSFCQKLQVLAVGAAPAGDLSEEVDEAQGCGVKPLGEEEGYDADSESNPEDMAKQEEGRSKFPATPNGTHSFLLPSIPPQESTATALTWRIQVIVT